MQNYRTPESFTYYNIVINVFFFFYELTFRFDKQIGRQEYRRCLLARCKNSTVMDNIM